MYLGMVRPLLLYQASIRSNTIALTSLMSSHARSRVCSRIEPRYLVPLALTEPTTAAIDGVPARAAVSGCVTSLRAHQYCEEDISVENLRSENQCVPHESLDAINSMIHGTSLEVDFQSDAGPVLRAGVLILVVYDTK